MVDTIGERLFDVEDLGTTIDRVVPMKVAITDAPGPPGRPVPSYRLDVDA